MRLFPLLVVLAIGMGAWGRSPTASSKKKGHILQQVIDATNKNESSEVNSEVEPRRYETKMVLYGRIFCAESEDLPHSPTNMRTKRFTTLDDLYAAHGYAQGLPMDFARNDDGFDGQDADIGSGFMTRDMQPAHVRSASPRRQSSGNRRPNNHNSHNSHNDHNGHNGHNDHNDHNNHNDHNDHNSHNHHNNHNNHGGGHRRSGSDSSKNNHNSHNDHNSHDNHNSHGKSGGHSGGQHRRSGLGGAGYEHFVPPPHYGPHHPQPHYHHHEPPPPQYHHHEASPPQYQHHDAPPPMHHHHHQPEEVEGHWSPGMIAHQPQPHHESVEYTHGQAPPMVHEHPQVHHHSHVPEHEHESRPPHSMEWNEEGHPMKPHHDHHHPHTSHGHPSQRPEGAPWEHTSFSAHDSSQQSRPKEPWEKEEHAQPAKKPEKERPSKHEHSPHQESRQHSQPWNGGSPSQQAKPKHHSDAGKQQEDEHRPKPHSQVRHQAQPGARLHPTTSAEKQELEESKGQENSWAIDSFIEGGAGSTRAEKEARMRAEQQQQDDEEGSPKWAKPIEEGEGRRWKRSPGDYYYLERPASKKTFKLVPVENATVTIHQPKMVGLTRISEPIARVMTDKDGYFWVEVGIPDFDKRLDYLPRQATYFSVAHTCPQSGLKKLEKDCRYVSYLPVATDFHMFEEQRSVAKVVVLGVDDHKRTTTQCPLEVGGPDFLKK